LPLQQIAIAFVGLGREKFQRDDWLASQFFRSINIADELHVLNSVSEAKLPGSQR